MLVRGKRANAGSRKAQRLALKNYDAMDKVPQKEKKVITNRFRRQPRKTGKLLARDKDTVCLPYFQKHDFVCNPKSSEQVSSSCILAFF